jgi:hypothetical protein
MGKALVLRKSLLDVMGKPRTPRGAIPSPEPVMPASPRAGKLPPRPPTVPRPTQEQFEAVHSNLQPKVADQAEHWGMGHQDVLDSVHKTMEHVLGQTRMVARAPLDAVPHIMQHGLLNQHAIPSSGALLDPDLRAHGEGKAFGIPAGSEHHAYPKYGYLEPQEAAERDPFDHRATAHFGDAKLVFKPHMRQRSTFTAGDSFDGMIDDTHLPAPMQAPHYTAAGKFLGKLIHAHDYPLLRTLKAPGGYWETQMHGPVTHEDIHHVEFPAEPPAHVQEALRARGVPWKVER